VGREGSGDIHIVQGPHFAKDRWLNARTILLDRAYYKEEKTTDLPGMDYVSLGWLMPNGRRSTTEGEGRPPPEIGTNNGKGTIFLADYGGPIEPADTVRRHPAEEKHTESLTEVLSRHKTAIGYTTTALIKAALMGLDVVSRDPTHILNNPDWLTLLPYIDWHYTEIQSGEAWEHLWQSR
jgi:hypothetical protein